MTLDETLRQLLDPAAPWQTARDIWVSRDKAGNIIGRLNVGKRYRERASGPYLLHHTPAGEYSPSADIALSRRDNQPPSSADVQAIVNALSRVVGWPGLEVIAMETVFGGRPARRLYWPPQYIPAVRTQTPPNSLRLHQAIVWDRNEQYEEEWVSLGISRDRNEAAGWLHRDQQLYMLRGQVVSYEVKHG